MKYNFVPIQKHRVSELKDPTVSITSWGVINFSKAATIKFGLDGAFVRLFADMDGKAIAIQVSSSINIANKDYRLVKKNKNGIVSLSATAALKSVNVLLKKFYKIKAEEHRDDIYGKLLIIKLKSNGEDN